jgi:site-specific recombinase XerD
MKDSGGIIVYPDNQRQVRLSQTTPRHAPDIVRAAGKAACFAWDEFFQGEIANAHTRKNYTHAIRKFLAWAEHEHLALLDITPGGVGQYFQEMDLAVPTKKLHLAALRKFFDRMVNRHVIVINPAATVRAERYSAVEGKTPEIQGKQAEALLRSIAITCQDESGTRPDLVGLRDRAILAVLIFTAARVGAVAKLSFKSLRHDGTEYTLRFSEKGGKSREIPVRSDLQKILLAYILAAGISAGPLFCTALGKTGTLTDNPITAIDICRMMKRRLKAASLPTDFSPHSFRVTTITDLLEHNTSLEDVQHLAGHADPRTTRLYDRRRRKITRNIVERISINVDQE